MASFSTSSLSRMARRARRSAGRKDRRDGERGQIRQDVLDQIQNRAAGVFVNLPSAEIEANVQSLLKVRRRKGEAAYQRRLANLRQWAVGVVQRQAAEPDRGDVVRGIVRTVLPAVVGGVVSAGIARIRGGGDPPGPIPGRRAPRAAAVRAKIPYHLYAALAQQGDPRAEQLRLRGMVAAPPPPPAAAPVGRFGRTMAGLRPQSALVTRRPSVAFPMPGPRAPQAQPQLWQVIQPGWFGG